MSGLPPAHCSRRHRSLWESSRSISLYPLVVLLCCLLSASGQSTSPLSGNSDSDGQALQSIRGAFGSPPSLSGWATGNPCTSSWTGIACTNVNGAPRVTTVSLNGVGLTGTLPNDLIKLTALQIMNMSNNAISGPLPANWGFGDVFTQLQIITLENNRLDGSLPASYSQGLKSLIVFNMGNNNFSGTLPEAWGGAGAFPRLRVLAMRNSSLQGPLPPAWGNSSRALPSLTILTMDSNKLSGSLPASWSQGLSSLSLLTLAGNQINGTLPPTWGQNSALPKLAILALSNNNVSGAFPDAWASGTAFPSMRGSGNGMVLQPGNPQLSGAVPLGTPYPVLRYNGPSGYSMCSQFPCTPLATAPGPSVALAPAMALAPSLAQAAQQGAAPGPGPILAPVPAPAMAPAPAPAVAPMQAAQQAAAPGPGPTLAPVPAPAMAPAPAPAVAPTQAAGKGQSLVTTFNLQGQGLYPLSDQGKQALLSAVNQTLAAKGDSVTNITLGQVTSLASAAPAPSAQIENVRRRQLLQGSQGSQAQVIVSTIAGAGSQEAQSIQNTLQQSVSSGQFANSLRQNGLSVNGVSLGGSSPSGSPAAQSPSPQSPGSPPTQAPAQAPAAATPSPTSSPQPSSAPASGSAAPPSGGGGGSSGLGLGAIIGIVVGAAAAIILAGLLVGCLALRQRRRRRADAKTFKSSPSTPAVPPPTSPVLQRQRSMDSSGGSFTKSGGSFTKSGGSFSNVGARPRSQTEQQMERTSSGKTHVIPYAQYKKSRLDSIRNDLGLQGGGPGQRDRVNGAGDSTPTTPRAGGSGV